METRKMTGKIIIDSTENNAEARAAFGALLQPGIDTGGGLQSVDDLLAGCALFEWQRGGDVIARHALRVVPHANGNEGVIVGAVGKSPYPFAQSLAIMEAQFLDVRQVTVHTCRLGMVRQLARCGYGMRAFVMGKKIQRGES